MILLEELTVKVAADWFVVVWLSACTVLFTWKFLKEVYAELKYDELAPRLYEYQAAMSCSLLALALWVEKVKILK